jgi:hypothetical protein
MSGLGPQHATEQDEAQRPDDLLARADAAIRESECLKRQVHASLDAAQVLMGKLHKTMGEISRSNLAGLVHLRPAPDEDRSNVLSSPTE